MLRLNTDILPSPNPARLGVLAGDTAGFPNGRRLTDDVVDITLQAAVGVLGGVRSTLGDGVNVNDVPFQRLSVCRASTLWRQSLETESESATGQ